MAWTSLAERYAYLPLVLAGPIVRKVTQSSVTIWVAMSGKCDSVFLEIYDTDTKSSPVLGSGYAIPIQIGGHLYVTAITVNGLGLQQDKIYFYDLLFHYNDQGEKYDLYLQDAGTLTGWNSSEGDISLIAYNSYQLPSFLLPASSVNNLKIMHGSCRKPHGGQMSMGNPQTPEYFTKMDPKTLDIDALSIVDDLISSSASTPSGRPQQLFLTGDQIYSDDVSDLLLYMITDARQVLVDVQVISSDGAEIPISESMPDTGTSTLDPLTRYDDINTTAKMSSGAYAKCHLMRLAEFYCMYLFAWSDVVWSELPGLDQFKSYWTLTQADTAVKEVFDLDEDDVQLYYDNEVKALKNFQAYLPKVRRALANIATYMMFDDHEITDDWFLDKQWCDDVLSTPLGKRVLQNGICGYAVFQAWGNTPERFADTTSDEYKLLSYLQLLYTEGYTSGGTADLIASLTLPKEQPGTGSAEIMSLTGGPDWFFYLDYSYYQVIVLNTRTRRGFNSKGLVRLLSTASFTEQLYQGSTDTSKYKFTILIAPAPVIGHTNLEFIQKIVGSGSHAHAGEYDYEPWAADPSTLDELLRTLLMYKNVIILSGDVHYAYSAQVDYKYNLNTGSPKNASIIQLTSSALKNSEMKTTLHAFLKAPFLGVSAMSVIQLDPRLYLLSVTDPFTLSGWKTAGVKGTVVHVRETKEGLESTTRSSLKVEAYENVLTQNNYMAGYTYEISDPADWQIQIAFQRDSRTPDTRGTVTYGTTTGADKGSMAPVYKKVTGVHQSTSAYTGMEVAVGFNNIGFISFSESTLEIAVQHELWYRPKGFLDEGAWTTHQLKLKK